MSAYQELSSGVVGRDTAQLVYETVAAVARIHRFPPPEGTDRWDADAVQDLAHDFMARDGFRGLIRLALTATDDPSLERLLDTSVRNYLRDTARSTVAGRISRSITRRLESMSNVRRVTGSGASALWMLDGSDPDGAAPSLEDLVASAYKLTGLATARVVARSQRGAALVDPESLEAVLRDALETAGCPLESSALLSVVTARFPVLVEGDTAPLDEAVDVPGQPVGQPLEVRAAADEVWAQLEHRERLALPVAAGSATVREMEEELGVSRSSIQRAATSAKAVLEVTVPAEDAQAVLRELHQRAEILRGGTLETRSPSSPDTGGTP